MLAMFKFLFLIPILAPSNYTVSTLIGNHRIVNYYYQPTSSIRIEENSFSRDVVPPTKKLPNVTFAGEHAFVCFFTKCKTVRAFRTRLDRIIKLDQPEHALPWRMSIVSRSSPSILNLWEKWTLIVSEGRCFFFRSPPSSVAFFFLIIHAKK